uniref:GPI inositol-deacylase n=1 Tax=Corethrella appendiculata TaxID=1370023 RepID=U5EZS7_9DIPT
MINKLFLVVSLINLCLFLYGVLITLTNFEENRCHLTFMYEFPNFIRIHFKENDQFPRYNLYAYSEGHLTKKARNMEFSGAPVIFIPGHSGSYKQARSLASVALRKGIDNNWIQHLDYFTVDFNEEYTGVFGGTLEDQTQFLEHCITSVLDLYKHLPNRPKSIVLVGHSMGGKVAQAMLLSPNVSKFVHTIINLATPMDKPVLSLDYYLQSYYDKIENYWSINREFQLEITNTTNTCCKRDNPIDGKVDRKNDDLFVLNDKLLITIGGGSRDIIIHPGLTNSKFSDIHAMATNIPDVWLTTDHLCIVWCLELVLVINRYLYSIIQPSNPKTRYITAQNFIEDKAQRLLKAKHYFKNPMSEIKTGETYLVNVNSDNLGDWVEDSRRVFTVKFKNGLNTTHFQMIRLLDSPHHKYLKVDAINLETDDWIFGCAANEVYATGRFCSQGVSLTKYAKQFPSLRHERTTIQLDLHNLKLRHPEWTHVIIKILPTNEPVKLSVDIHDPDNRKLTISMPKWYSFNEVKLLDDTILGGLLYKIELNGMEETYQSVSLNLDIRSCSSEHYNSVVKVCVPWTKGFDRYHFFTDTKKAPMYIYPPTPKPLRYNTTANPISIELNLDPNCRYRINYQNSISMTMARLVQQYSHWIPAHLVSIILLAFKHQISLTPNAEKFKCGKLHKALLRSTSPFFIIFTSRVFAKFFLWFKELPQPEAYDVPVLLSVMIHGSALALLTLITAGTWAGICFCGNFAHKILFKLISLPIPTISSAVVSGVQKFPITAAALLISIALGSCGGIALICGCLIYFILLAKMYEDYLEEFVFNTAKLIARKLFGKSKKDDKNDKDEKDEIIEQENSDDIKNEPSTSEKSETTVKSDKSPEELAAEKELQKLIDESLEKQSLVDKENEKAMKAQRAEYDSVHDGLSQINFHLPMFFLLLVISGLNFPSTITWAKHYFNYSQTLRPDPSLIPALVMLVCSGIIWQLPTPRNIVGYKPISSLFYILAVICVLYCQESLYRLNFIICTVYMLIAIHQLISPKCKEISQEQDDTSKIDLDKIKNILENSNLE